MEEKQIGDYKILKQIGAGGMARVYLGVHKDVPNLKVVLKVLSDPRQAERFKQEADKLALLDRHPHICKIKHFFNHGDELVIVMEYIEGKSLKEILEEKGQLSIPEALKITCDIISALEPAHQQGIFHRDIKPGNIMFKESGQVKIIDFGIAKAKTDPSLTIVGTSAGTPDYMAPEQFDASEDIDYSKSDIYAVGTMLFRMLTGELPFKGANEFALRDAKLFESPPRPSKLNGEIGKELENIIIKSIHSDPEKRFSSVREMREKLEAVSQGYEVKETLTSIQQPGEGRQAQAPGAGGRRKVMYISVAAVIAAAVAVYMLLIRPAPADTGKIDVTITPASNIYIDGRLAGSSTSVQSAELEPGRHTIRIQNKSALFRQDIIDTIDVAAGTSLRRDYYFDGALEIGIHPSGSLYINDSLISSSVTSERLAMQPGRHIIRVANLGARGRKEFLDTIRVAANKVLERDYSFTMPSNGGETSEHSSSQQTGPNESQPAEREEEAKPVPGTLILGSRPRGGQIFIDGELQEHRTPYTFSLPPGEHTVRIIIVEDGQTFEHLYRVNIRSGKSEKVLFKPLE